MPIDSCRVEGRAIGYLQAAETFECDHTRGRQIPEHAGDLDGRIVGKVGREALGVARLVQVVQFSTKSASELDGHADEVDAGRSLPASTSPRGQVLQDLQVLVHLLHGAGAANLDDDLGPIVQRRGVRLADGRARQRLGVESRESCISTR